MNSEPEEELIDVFDENLRKVGVRSRTSAHQEGAWHQVFHCWILAARNSGHVLIAQQRSSQKANWPSKFDISVAGHLVAGESAADGVREIREELGVDARADDLLDIGDWREVQIENGLRNREFSRTYLLRESRPLQAFDVLPVEVAGLVEIPLGLGEQLFSGRIESVQVEGFWPNKSTALRTISLRTADFVPRTDDYYLKIFKIATQLTRGENPVALSPDLNTTW